jgi:spermidine synthase
VREDGRVDQPVEFVERARATSPRGEVVLRERREAGGPPVLELRVNGVFVMDTAETTSERALATEALALADRPRTVLVGGLGLGFTLAEVLADPRVEQVTVAELEPALVGWLRDGTVPHGPALLADARVRVVEGDVASVLAAAGDAAYDLVLLDVDNGPGYLVHDANAALYERPFLATVHRVTRGVAVVWAAEESPALTEALAAVFGEARATPYAVRLQGRAEEYWLHVARRRERG